MRGENKLCRRLEIARGGAGTGLTASVRLPRRATLSARAAILRLLVGEQRTDTVACVKQNDGGGEKQRKHAPATHTSTVLLSYSLVKFATLKRDEDEQGSPIYHANQWLRFLYRLTRPAASSDTATNIPGGGGR